MPFALVAESFETLFVQILRRDQHHVRREIPFAKLAAKNLT